MLLISLASDIIGQTKRVFDLKNHMHDTLAGRFSPDASAVGEGTREEWNQLPWKRYQYFYGVLVPVIIHDALFRLHKTPMTNKLRKVVSAQALVTGIFDDLFDRLHLPPDRIRALMDTPDQIVPSYNIEEYLCQYLFREIHQHFTGNHKLLEDSVRAIMDAQELSFQQLQHSATLTPRSDISIDDLLHITKEIGEKAVLFYRSCIDEALTAEEHAFLAELGGLFQMTNDINDALKDRQAGESTLMTMGLTLREIREIFDAQIRQTFESWKSLSNDKYHKKGVFSRINILVARSLVTLDRYSHLVDSTVSFDIRDIPPGKIISGLKIPYEVRNWYKYDCRLNQ